MMSVCQIKLFTFNIKVVNCANDYQSIDIKFLMDFNKGD